MKEKSCIYCGAMNHVTDAAPEECLAFMSAALAEAERKLGMAREALTRIEGKCCNDRCGWIAKEALEALSQEVGK